MSHWTTVRLRRRDARTVAPRAGVLLALGLVLAALPLAAPGAAGRAVPPSYTNPLPARTADGQPVDNCPDPSVLHGRGAHAGRWYLYCTSGPLNDSETDRQGTIVQHLLPMLSSPDLVHWTFAGSALPQLPAWAAPGARLWAPDVVYSTTYHRYYLTYTVTDTVDAVSGAPGCSTDSAIGLATSTSPLGPWRQASGGPVAGPRRTGPGCSFASTIDPDVLGDTVAARGVLFYGGHANGIQAQEFTLSRYGLALSGTRHRISSNRYEAANVVARGGYYYLFVSADQCCEGPLSGYGVLVGRSARPLGPYRDREGNDLAAARTGGTPVLSSSGNRWVGPGQSSAFRDLGGQWWAMYHAVDLTDPYFAGRPGFTRRPVLLDPLDWVDGWPSVRSGRGASAIPVPGPAAQPGERSAYRPRAVAPDVPGTAIPAASDEFDGARLAPRWSWVRKPARSAYRLTGTALNLRTSAGDLSPDGTAPVLTERAPVGNYVVETAVRLDLPRTGDVRNPVGAGLVVYADDDRFVSLLHRAQGAMRLTPFAKEVPDPGPRLHRAGAMTVGPPGDLTELRLVHRLSGGHELFRAYTRQDGRRWIRGGTWVYDGLGSTGRIGLVALGGAGYTASFQYVRARALR